MADALPYLLLIGIALQTVVWLIALYDAIATPRDAWTEAGRSRPSWIGIVLVFQSVGGLIFWLIPRPGLRTAMRQIHSTHQAAPTG